jgi:hypothetical protein
MRVRRRVIYNRVCIAYVAGRTKSATTPQRHVPQNRWRALRQHAGRRANTAERQYAAEGAGRYASTSDAATRYNTLRASQRFMREMLNRYYERQT